MTFVGNQTSVIAETKHGLVYTIEKCAIGCAMGSLCYVSFWNKTPACKNMKSCLFFGGLCACVFLLRIKKTKDFESIHNLILQMATKNTSHGIGQQRQQTQNGSETLQLSYIHALYIGRRFAITNVMFPFRIIT